MLLCSLFPTGLLLSQPRLEQSGLSVSFVGFISVNKYFVAGTFTLGKTHALGLPLLSQDCCCREKGLGGILAALEVAEVGTVACWSVRSLVGCLTPLHSSGAQGAEFALSGYLGSSSFVADAHKKEHQVLRRHPRRKDLLGTVK